VPAPGGKDKRDWTDDMTAAMATDEARRGTVVEGVPRATAAAR
jgi:hypothetical protein